MKLVNKYNHQLTEARNLKIQNILDRRQNDLTVILENVNDPHNIAAVLRTCDAIGMMEVFVLNTKENSYRNFDSRKSSSANKWMPVRHFDDLNECFQVVRKQYPLIFSTYLNDQSKDLFELDLCQSMALVFGNEHSGISPEALALCDGNFIIPQVGIIQSLNISVACAVVLYEAYRQKRLAHHYDHKKLNAEQENRLLEFWELNADNRPSGQ